MTKLGENYNDSFINYFEIYLENGTLKERLSTPEDTIQAIEEESNEDSNLTASPNQSKEKKQKIKKKKKPEKKNSNIKANPQQPSSSNNNNINIENINEIKDEKQKMEILIAHIIDLKKDIKDMQANFVEENKIRDNNIYQLEKELSEVKSDLNLIKSRDALKVFIDFFYKGAGFTEYLPYGTRVDNILKNFHKYEDNKKYNNEIIKMIIKLLKTSAKKIKLGNFDAHNFETDDILLHIFEIIDPKKECNALIERLKNIKADKVVNEILLKREEYYYDKNLVEKEEKKIIEEYSIKEKYYEIFMKPVK